MDANVTKRIADGLLREAGAPGAEHNRLEAELREWAERLGYKSRYQSFRSGVRPDVLHECEGDAGSYLFVGDAKDGANQTSRTPETVRQIRRYFDEFGALLGQSGYRGGLLAIATNSAEEAERWVVALNILAAAAGLQSTPSGEPDFSVVETSPGETWIVSW
jgi:hypothetical protein